MGYIRNADLTRADVLRLVARLGYEDITAEVNHAGYVLTVRDNDGVLIQYSNLAAARRALQNDIDDAREQGLLQ